MAIFGFEFNFDADRGVVQTDGDGGDRPARTGLFHFLMHLLKKYCNVLYLNVPNQGAINFDRFLLSSQNPQGDYFRSPEYQNPKDLSRDQLWALISAMGAYQLHSQIKQLLIKGLKNFNRAPNGDFLGPAFWAHSLRSLKAWYFYPLILLFDFELILGSLAICFINAKTPGPVQKWLGENVHWIFIMGERPTKEGTPREPYGPDSTGNDINHTTALLQALVFPTPLSWLARYLYRRLRPQGVQYAWDRYFDPIHKGNPFNELARPLLTKYFKTK